MNDPYVRTPEQEAIDITLHLDDEPEEEERPEPPKKRAYHRKKD